MAIPVIMPKQGQSVETCIISRWFRNTGDRVAKGDILFSYETDKAAFDLESPGDGILLEIFFSEGDEVPVLMNVAVIGEHGESTESFNPLKEIKSAAKSGSQEEKVPDSLPDPEPESEKLTPLFDSRIRISPRAKRIAENNNLNYNNLKGTGPYGRIIVSDIEKALSNVKTKSEIPGSQEIEFSEQPLSNVRKLIARAMYTSLQSSAQLTHHMSADVSRILEARRKIKEEIASGSVKQDITLNDMICWCVIRALLKYPEINSHLLDDSIRKFHTVNLGIAVDTPRGLMVPAVRKADLMDLEELSLELRSAAEACRKGNISPELIQSTSASFTVSNLGSYGVEMFTPVINLPQTGILGICTIINRPADLGNNTFGFVPFIGLSLTYDHRAIDGGPATLFLKEIKKQIEGFEG
jgi:pyruvate dehydrogenase E2 component (dihydrolipoamide acetyltransferase)